MKLEEAATILQTLVEGRDPSSGEELPADNVCQGTKVLRALLVGCTAIETVLARQRRRAQLPRRVGSTWTTEEDSKLRSGFQAGRSIESLASSHQRTPKSIQGRLERLNLVPPERRSSFRFPASGAPDHESQGKQRGGAKPDRDQRSEADSPDGATE
jgi:hypothetical protein